MEFGWGSWGKVGTVKVLRTTCPSCPSLCLCPCPCLDLDLVALPMCSWRADGQLALQRGPNLGPPIASIPKSIVELWVLMSPSRRLPRNFHMFCNSSSLCCSSTCNNHTSTLDCQGVDLCSIAVCPCSAASCSDGSP